MENLLPGLSYSHKEMDKKEILVVTGYSGAGKSTVLRALEDIGFFCIDNLPVQLIHSLFHFVSQPLYGNYKLALGIDSRAGQNIEHLIEILNRAQEFGLHKVKIFFLSASSQVLCKRFQETRRKHPLGENIDLMTAIAAEKNLLKPLVGCANFVLETDQFTIHELRNFVRISFASHNNDKVKLIVNLISFGFKYGIPQESNMIYDIRFLPNPYFISHLRPLDGRHQWIDDYLFNQHIVQEYWQKLVDFLHYSIKKSYDEGRSFITVSIGCTGGRHRSVAFVERIMQQNIAFVQFIVKHRDINQDSYKVL